MVKKINLIVLFIITLSVNFCFGQSFLGQTKTYIIKEFATSHILINNDTTLMFENKEKETMGAFSFSKSDNLCAFYDLQFSKELLCNYFTDLLERGFIIGQETQEVELNIKGKPVTAKFKSYYCLDETTRIKIYEGNITGSNTVKNKMVMHVEPK